MPLTDPQRVAITRALGRATDEFVALPLWSFHPHYRPFVLVERKRRNILQNDPEPTGDSEYS